MSVLITLRVMIPLTLGVMIPLRSPHAEREEYNRKSATC
jgi:hypothetical protein